MVDSTAEIEPLDDNAALNMHNSRRYLHLMDIRSGTLAGSHYLIVNQGLALVEEPRHRVCALISDVQGVM